ncbi:hypothetical protein RND81_12G104300 [Saponaria officinalis]|uniref:Peptidase A1 domain-containing protein n=1 Tax=Saponaria officinalis TaxID=3572 RepID=A0AAW1H8Y3_SAPOF
MFTTPLHILPNHKGYCLTLHDIGVDGQKLNIPSNLFALNPDNSGGTIINPGTVLTYIVPDAFDILIKAITDYISNLNLFLHRYQGQTYGFEACWHPFFNSPTVYLPTLTFYFENNADLLVQSSEVFWIFPEPGINQPGLYCLTIRRGEPHAANVIGSSVQTNQRFVYDVAKLELSFAAEMCAM